MKTHNQIKLLCKLIAVAFAATSAHQTYALVISENFTGGTTQNQWLMPLPGDGVHRYGTTVVNNACLTAGTSTTRPNATSAGSPPKCSGVNDTIGNGALRLTPDSPTHQVGGIVSNFTFPTNEGVEITFTTYTWSNVDRTGADGMTFFLSDGSRPATLGASGGSLGYPCSYENPIFSGVDGGYIGIGMDEYGNFANGWDNSSSGLVRPAAAPWNIAYNWHRTQSNVSSERSAAINGFRPNAISIRGAGSTNYNYIGDPNRFLQDVYNRFGWGTVSADAATRWRNYWNISNSNLWSLLGNNICTNGRITIDSQFLPSGQSSITLADVEPNNSKYKFWNYHLLAYSPLNWTMYTRTNTRTTATPIQYRIRITPDGKASVWYSRNGGTYQPVMLDFDVVSANGPLPSSFRFGFMGATGGSVNNHEVTCFKAAPTVGSEGSAAANLPDARIVAGTQMYLSLFNPLYWTGQLQAKSLVKDTAGNYDVQNTANWDASCNLTGGLCESTGNTTVPVQAPNDRVFWTWNGSSGISLDWSNLTAAQKTSLQNTGETETIAQKRLDYLKGNRLEEQTNPGDGKLFRKRNNVLSDIINSSPTWVGYPNNKTYADSWTDKRYPTATPAEPSGSYNTYITNQKTRTNVVYVGSNDGFLHGFRSGNYNTSNAFDTTQNDGREMLAYMPASVLARINNKTDTSLNFTHSQYAHNFYNDATPATGDVFYKGEWHTWLLSGLGAGGNTVYALDVTDPSDFKNSTANKYVIGEWSYNATDNVWKNLGNSYGTPVFGRFHDGNWGAVFGNGWCSSTDAANGNCTASAGPAGIYVMSIDKNTGVPSFRFISTGESGTLANPNGIANVTPVDIDGDKIYDYAYAGDIKGNVWRFNLSSDNANTWASSQPQKIFTTQANQPISTKIAVSQVNQEGDVVLNFGTGIRKEGYLGAATTYATSPQSLYGLRDKTVIQFPNTGSSTAQITLSQLQQQTINSTTNELSGNTVDWDNKSGWYLNLTTVTNADGTREYEQVIYNPSLQRDKFVFANTFINGSAPLLSCTTSPSSGYTYPMEALTGKGLKDIYVLDPNTLLTYPSNKAYRYRHDAVGTSLFLTDTETGKTIEVYKKSDGTFGTATIKFDRKIKRISWREIF